MLDLLKRHIKATSAFYRGNREYQRGDFEDSIASYQETLIYKPDAPVVRFNLGLALYKNGQKREGRAEWERVVELTERKNPYLCEQGKMMLRQFS